MQELGGSLGVAIIGSVVAAAFGHSPAELAANPALHEAFTQAMDTGFIVAAAVALAGAAIALRFLPGRAALALTAHADHGPTPRAAGSAA